MDYRTPPLLSILIADSREENRLIIRKRLQSTPGWTLSIESSAQGDAAIERLRETPYDLVFIGPSCPQADALTMLVQIRQLFEKTAAVMVFSEHTEAVAVSAMKQGALDCLTLEEFISLDTRQLLRRVVEVRELSNMNMELRQINQMKNEFIANVSHEFRTPLSVVLGFSKSLQDSTLGPVNERQRKALEAITDRAEGLLLILNQILKFRQAHEGKEKLLLKPCDLRAVLEHYTRSAPKGFAKKGMRFDVILPENPVWVLADSEKLIEILDNLVSNAVKFGPSQTAIVVRLSADEGSAHLSVRDEGPGIAHEVLPHVFEAMFAAGQGPIREYPGLGLGLPLSKQLVNLHFGKIWIDSQGAGTGTTAHVSLPLSTPNSPEVLVGQETPIKKKQILIVEDNPDLVEVLMLFMSSISPNLRVYATNSGFSALESLKEQLPNLIILDVMMPGMSGLELIERLRKLPETKEIPVLVLTGYQEGAQLAIKNGAKDVLLKPFEKTVFIKKVTRLLQSHNGKP